MLTRSHIRHVANQAKCLLNQTPSSLVCKRNNYGGTWKSCRRLQNPDMLKQMPTYEFVKNGQFKKRNMIYVCGFGATGSLGIPRYYRPDKMALEHHKPKDIASSTFRRLVSLSHADNIHDVACGYGFTIVAAKLKDTDHRAVGFGLNSHSQLGYQSARAGYPLEIVSTPLPIVLPAKSEIVSVSCGRSHSLFVDADGKVYSLGNNSFGQCARPIQEDENYFGSKRVHVIRNLPSNVSQVSCGQDHSFFLTQDGKLFACGWGADGQTGLGHYDNQVEPAQVKGDVGGANIIKVSSCADTVLALDDKGNVFGWGNTEYAQFRMLANCESEQFNVPKRLKLDKVPGKIVDIAAGGTMCAILNDRGQVYVWGFGILGKGPNVDQSSRPSLIPETLFGTNVYHPEVKVDKIYAGLSHFAAISNTGDLYTWGKNRGQSLGFAHSGDQYFPMRVNMNLAKVKKVALGVDHTCALVEKVC